MATVRHKRVCKYKRHRWILQEMMKVQSTRKGGEEAGARWLKWVVGVVWFTHSRIKEITGGRAEGSVWESGRWRGSSTPEGQRSN